MNTNFQRYFLNTVAILGLNFLVTGMAPAHALSIRQIDDPNAVELPGEVTVDESESALPTHQVLQAVSDLLAGRTFVGPDGKVLTYRSVQDHQDGYSIEQVIVESDGGLSVIKDVITLENGEWFFKRSNSAPLKLSAGDGWLKLEAVHDSIGAGEYSTLTFEKLARGGVLWISETSYQGEYYIDLLMAE